MPETLNVCESPTFIVTTEAGLLERIQPLNHMAMIESMASKIAFLFIVTSCILFDMQR